MNPITKTSYQILHSCKTAAACLFAFAFIDLTHLPYGQWALITIIVVMSAQINVGSFLKKAQARIIGTLLGAVVGISTLFLFGSNVYIIGLVITAATLGFTYWGQRQSAYLYAGVLGSVTIVSILLQTTPTLMMGFIRVSEVLLGIFIASLFTVLIFPIRASEYFLHILAMNLQLNAKLFTAVMINDQPRKSFSKTDKLDALIVKQITELRVMVDDSAVEWPKNADRLALRRKIFQAHKMLHRYINLLEFCYHFDPTIHGYLIKLDSFKQFILEVRNALNQIAEAIISRKSISLTSLDATFGLFSQEANQSSAQNDEQLWIMHTFLLGAKRMVVQLNKHVDFCQDHELAKI